MKSKKKIKGPLGVYNIKVLTYTELVDNAYSVYSEYIKKSELVGELQTLLDNIRTYQRSAVNDHPP